MTDSPIPGEVRMMGGKEYRFIERELEGDKWEAVASPIPAAPSDVAGAIERLTDAVNSTEVGHVGYAGSGWVLVTQRDIHTLLALSLDREVMRVALAEIEGLPALSVGPVDEFDRGARAARLDAADIAQAALASLKGGA
jgi:hypothetical protein